ncbi:MAG: hypothetical protein KC501_17055 [Myxococcales bacterium]|nr:hypothetical protein [Myxococcales bacterium]
MSLRRATLLGVRVLVVAWPLAHLILTVATPMSSWKLGGLGMYAEPDASQRSVLVIALRGIDPQRPLPSIGPMTGMHRVLERGARGGLVPRPWEPRAGAGAIEAAFERFSVLASAEAAQELVTATGEGSALVVLALPRVDLRQRVHYHEVHAFLVTDTESLELGCIARTPQSSVEIEARLREAWRAHAQARPPRLARRAGPRDPSEDD